MIAFAYWFGWAIGASCATWICVSHNTKNNNESEEKMIPVSSRALLGSYAKKMRDIIHEVQANETDEIVIHKLAEVAADCAWCERNYAASARLR